jgi:hypothetical protein
MNMKICEHRLWERMNESMKEECSKVNGTLKKGALIFWIVVRFAFRTNIKKTNVKPPNSEPMTTIHIHIHMLYVYAQKRVKNKEERTYRWSQCLAVIQNCTNTPRNVTAAIPPMKIYEIQIFDSSNGYFSELNRWGMIWLKSLWTHNESIRAIKKHRKITHIHTRRHKENERVEWRCWTNKKMRLKLFFFASLRTNCRSDTISAKQRSAHNK